MAKSQKFNLNQLVMLNSGGPPMTIQQVLYYAGNDAYQYICAWIDKIGNPRKAYYMEHSLKEAEEQIVP